MVSGLRVSRVLGFALAVYLLGRFAVELAPTDSTVAAWWPAAGVSVAVVARHHSRRWVYVGALVVASGLANLTAGRELAVSLGFALSNAAEAVVVGAWLNRRDRRPVLERVSDVWSFVWGSLLGALTIGVGAALTVWAFTSDDAMHAFRNVVPSHLAAVLLIAPLMFSTPAPLHRRPVEVASLWALSVLATVVVFWPGQTLPIAFVTIPALMLSGVRLGVRAATAQLAVVGVLVTVLTARGGGAFASFAGEGRWALADPVSLVQLFIITGGIVVLTVAVALSDRERAVQRATASEVLYRAGFVEALVGMVLVRLDAGRAIVTEINPPAAELLGVRAGQELPATFETPDGRSLRSVVTSLASGTGWSSEVRSVTDGDRWCNVSASSLTGVEDRHTVALQLVDTSERHATEAELARRALLDPLTGLPNRAALSVHIDEALEHAGTTEPPLALMFIDIDDFKAVNDVYGHAMGDRLLAEIAKRLRAVIRQDDVVARIGGDEFVILCRSAGTPAFALTLAERVWIATEEPVRIAELDYQVSFSVGLTLSGPGSTSGQLLSQADVALHAAKASGKRRVMLYSDELGERAAHELHLIAEIRDAVKRDEFEMHMQPVVDIATGRVTAAEALIRWRHPERGLQPPGDWLDLAERTGIMPDLGAWVLDESVRQARRWVELVGVERAPVVHVNVSPRQLDRPDFAALVLRTVDRHGLAPSQLVLEVTETFLARVTGAMIEELETLVRHGIRIAADDFGTGYSPLTRIVTLPIGIIKIDRTFISALPDDDRSLAIVDALVTLANDLQLDVVAEGVETDAQLRALAALRCDAAQGYHWSPAVPATEFESAYLGTTLRHGCLDTPLRAPGG